MRTFRDRPGAQRATWSAVAGALALSLALAGCAGSDVPGAAAPAAALASGPVASTAPSSAAGPSPAAAPAAAAPAPDPASLAAGAQLMPASALVQSGGYRLLMQDDGDLVLLWGSAVLWSAGTGGHPGACAGLTPAGDFAVTAADGSVLWSAGTAGSGAELVTVTPSGDLVVAAAGGPVWTAGSDGHRGRITVIADTSGAELRMQEDGNLVAYAGGAATWSAGTAGHPGAVADLQPDGNLVVSADGTVLWSSGTAGSGATEVRVTESGNVELLTPAGARAWLAIAPIPAPTGAAPRPAPAATAPPAAGGGGSSATSPPAAQEPAPAAPAPAPVSSDYGLAASLIAEINAYRQANGLAPLQVSGSLNGYAQSCAAGMAAVDAPLAHCRSGEIIQYNTNGSPSAWLVAFQNSPAHNAIMLLPDVVFIGGGVSLSPGGRYYSVINVSY